MPVSANMQGYLSRLAYLESAGSGDNAAVNPSSGARGRFQFLPSTLTDAQQRLGINPATLVADDPAVQFPAVANYIRTINPSGYAEIEAGRFSAADQALRGTWPSLPGGSQAQATARQQQANAFLPGGSSAGTLPGGGGLAPGEPAVPAGPPVPLETQNGKPVWQITIDGQDRTGTIGDRLLSITSTDYAGQQTDTVELRIDDRDKRVEAPPTGATMGISVGYEGQQLQQLGTFMVDEVGFSATPREIQIKGLGLAAGGGGSEGVVEGGPVDLPPTSTGAAQASQGSREYIKLRRTQSWHDKTLEEIAQEIATRNGFTLEIKGVEEIKIRHEDQTNESDANFMTRIAEKYGLVIKPADGNLAVTPRGAGLLGRNIGIEEVQVTSWSARTKERSRYKTIKAKWLDRETRKEKVYTITSKQAQSGSTFELPQLFRDEQEAKAAASGKLGGLTSGVMMINITMPGVPGLTAEGSITLTDFRDELDGQPWVIRQIAHSISSGGFVTTIEAGTPGQEGGGSEGGGAVPGAFSGGPTEAGTYIEGGYGPGGANDYDPHFHIEKVGGDRNYGRTSLDQYVLVNGAPLSRGYTVPGSSGGEIGADRPRGAGAHNGRDYAFGGGAKLKLTGGAQWIGSSPGSYGDNATFRTPDGRTFRIIHGTFQP